MGKSHVLFLTGKLAEPALRRILAEVSSQIALEYRVGVLPITVAALATTPWIATHFQPEPDCQRVLLPGLCQGDLAELSHSWQGIEVQRGPTDLRALPEFLGSTAKRRSDYGAHDITILAEINHAPRLRLAELVARAKQAHADGADIIDLGCDPGHTWESIGDAVRALRNEGLRVSLDTFNATEAERGARAGAELVLSVNHTNRAQARDWGCAVVVVPDDLPTLAGLEETLAVLEGVPVVVDPVLEPIGFGFAASLGRYLEVRRRFPHVEMMMGVGNLTELTDVDSAGVNVLLLGFCQELRIGNVLTTEVINWCGSSVREIDHARRLVHHSVKHGVLPKHLDADLVMLRDPKLQTHGQDTLDELASNITDRNIRLFAERGLLHAMNKSTYLQESDPFVLFSKLMQHEDIDPAHAFYLGYEMAKAVTALTLGKNYTQDQALRWGILTQPETSHRGRGDDQKLQP